MARDLAIGIDAGGTKTSAVVLDAAGTIVDRRLTSTPAADADATTHTIVSVARELMASWEDVAVLGVGAAGMVDAEGVVRFAPNVAWRDYPLAERIADEVAVPSVVDNDANTAAWGEYRLGAGSDSTEMLLLTVGTGIGGGIVSGGRLLRGARGFAGEVGHVVVEPGGPPCGCGNQGCWEQMASGTAIQRLGREAARLDRNSLIERLAEGDARRVTGTVVTTAAERGDPQAIEILSKVGHRLGEGIAGLVNILDPEVVVIAGGAVRAGELLLGPARIAFGASVEGRDRRPEVPLVPAALGRDAGAVGAAQLARDMLSREGPEL